MKILESEHVFICGRTGSGKTWLAENFLAGMKTVVALDTKGFIEWENAGEVEVVSTLKEVEKFYANKKLKGMGKIIYRPVPAEMNLEDYNKFFEYCYNRQNITVYIDELMSVADSTHVPFFLKAILTRGRQRNTSCWALTQRPSGIPIITISEAKHFFVFDMNMEEDRKRISKVTGCLEIEERPGVYGKNHGIHQDYLFWYYNFKMDNPTLSVLKQQNNRFYVQSWLTK
jgi:hypothetical protein